VGDILYLEMALPERRFDPGAGVEGEAAVVPYCDQAGGRECPETCARYDALGLGALGALRVPGSEEQLALWSGQILGRSVPHKAAIFGFGLVHPSGLLVDRAICVNLSESYVRGLCDDARDLRSPALYRWFRRRTPVFLEAPDFGGVSDAKWRANFSAHGFKNCVVDGLLAPIAGRFTFLTLFDVCGDAYRCPKALRKFATLPAHRAWLERSSPPADDLSVNSTAFTLTERNLVELLRKGKTDKEMGRILGKSPATVKIQLRGLRDKLRVRNRTELISLLGGRE